MAKTSVGSAVVGTMTMMEPRMLGPAVERDWSLDEGTRELACTGSNAED
jgi:hypothetical protein